MNPVNAAAAVHSVALAQALGHQRHAGATAVPCGSAEFEPLA